MAIERSDIKREVDVPCDRREVPIGRVSVGETWSFSASGQWTNGFIRCGPNGYRNFLADAFQIAPREEGQPWLRLMGRVNGKPDSTFPIGAGCTKTFGHAGDLVVFANDKPDGYSNNRGSVKLTARQGGVAPTQGADIGGWIGAWHQFRDVFSRTAGIPIIAAFVFGVSWILVFMRQGQDRKGRLSMRSMLLKQAFIRSSASNPLVVQVKRGHSASLISSTLRCSTVKRPPRAREMGGRTWCAGSARTTSSSIRPAFYRSRLRWDFSSLRFRPGVGRG